MLFRLYGVKLFTFAFFSSSPEKEDLTREEEEKQSLREKGTGKSTFHSSRTTDIVRKLNILEGNA